MTWIIRILFAIAGSITALFVARDALNFSVVQTLVGVILITAIIGVSAFWKIHRRS